MVKWNDGSKAQVPFNSIWVDTRPILKPAIDPKGPGPMDLGSTDHPELTCYQCHKKGHIARVCQAEVSNMEGPDRNWEEVSGLEYEKESKKGSA